MTPKKNRLRVIPLGGLDEIGKNMTVLEYEHDMVVVDAGLMFPDPDHPGVDLILPDYSYILQRAEKLKGIVLTHGHEDHVGALPYLLRDLGRPVPVLGTRLTLGLVGDKLAEHRITNAKLREVRTGGHVSLGIFGFDFIPVNHSIPDGCALFIRTPVGNVLHTGDFKFDQTPVDGRLTDLAAIAKAGSQGVRLLLSDSTGAENPGYSRAERTVGETLQRMFREADKRIIVASFASHLHRMQQVCDAAVDAGRKVVVTGRSMINNTRIGRDLGYLHIDSKDILDAYDAANIPGEEVVVLCTGSQGEPLSALARMANGDHKSIRIQAGDTVVISASPVPGNEMAVNRVINRLSKAGATVLHKGSASAVHVSGHAASEELKLMLNLAKPEYFMPVHGENRHMRAHLNLATSVGIPEENVFMLENGDCLELTDRGAKLAERVDSGVVYVDGLSVGDISQVVLRDRQLLASDGIATVVMALDEKRGKVIGEPELVTRGVVIGYDGDEVHDEARIRLRTALEKMEREGVTDPSIIERHVRESLSQFFWERNRTRPMIIPVVVEV